MRTQWTTLTKTDRPFNKRPTREQLERAQRLARKVGRRALEMMKAKEVKDGSRDS